MNDISLKYKVPLSVHVMFHERYEYGDETFDYIYGLLCRNYEIPQIDGLDIPVYRYKGGENSQIPSVDFNMSDKFLILPLITIEMYCDSCWQAFLSELVNRIKEHKNCIILPISMCDYSFGFINEFEKNK